jgi:hypothetical protein
MPFHRSVVLHRTSRVAVIGFVAKGTVTLGLLLLRGRVTSWLAESYARASLTGRVGLVAGIGLAVAAFAVLVWRQGRTCYLRYHVPGTAGLARVTRR